MKRIILLVASLPILLGTLQAQNTQKHYAALRRAKEQIEEAKEQIAEAKEQIEEAKAQISAQQIEALSIDERRQLARQLNDYATAAEFFEQARQDRVLGQFDLSPAQRRQLESIYKEYREALDKSAAVGPEPSDTREMGDTELLRYLKRKLSAIAAAAEVKKTYVDRFATLLTAEQIRALYNMEGRLAARLREAAAPAEGVSVVTYGASAKVSTNGKNARRDRKLVGSGRLVSQQRPDVGSYSGIDARQGIRVRLSAATRSVTVTADDNVIDYLRIQKQGGTVRIFVDADNLQNFHAEVVMPQSSDLSSVVASSAASVTCDDPLRTRTADLTASSAAAISANVGADACRISVSSSGSVSGEIRADNCSAQLSSAGQLTGNIVCKGGFTCNVSSSARFKGSVTSGNASLVLTSGSRTDAGLKIDGLCVIEASSSSSYTGSVTARTLKASASSGARIAGSLEADMLSATGSSSAQIAFRGTAQKCIVELSSGARFNSPELRIADCSVTASSSSRADVYCTGTLRTRINSGARLTYDGPCTMESESPSIRRR